MTQVSTVTELDIIESMLSADCDDLSKATPEWTLEDATKFRREQHRANMVAFRRKKKQKGEKLKDEHRRLEKQMKLLTSQVHAVAATPGAQATTALQNLVVEKEDLKSQNQALKQEIARHLQLQSVIQTETEALNETEASALLPESGWRVVFPKGEPSFHFYPFTQNEFADNMERFDADLKSSSKSLKSVGTFLGWDVQRTPLSFSNDGSILARARFVKHIRCSLDVHLKVSTTKQKDLSPVVVTPMGWSLRERPDISTQVLQQFDQDSLLFVHNIPGDVNLRYLFQLRRAEWKLPNGKRRLTFSLNIVDSAANRRSRDAEGPQGDVEWFTEGGLNVSLTEVDDNSIYAVSDHWVGCHSTKHAEYMLVQWAQFAVWWEEMTAPKNLIL